MRNTGNFNLEWGYLAPAPSFLRSVRLVVVAATIAATASAAVVFALVRQPAAEASVAARTLVPPVEVASAPKVPVAAELQTQSEHASTPDAQHAAGATRRKARPPSRKRAPLLPPLAVPASLQQCRARQSLPPWPRRPELRRKHRQRRRTRRSARRRRQRIPRPQLRGCALRRRRTRSNRQRCRWRTMSYAIVSYRIIIMTSETMIRFWRGPWALPITSSRRPSARCPRSA